MAFGAGLALGAALALGFAAAWRLGAALALGAGLGRLLAAAFSAAIAAFSAATSCLMPSSALSAFSRPDSAAASAFSALPRALVAVFRCAGVFAARWRRAAESTASFCFLTLLDACSTALAAFLSC
ncbi:MAG TPA: hypothetical protein DIW43_14985 [Spongiibacteraceae bacterium]|nr:hypothetical protein [Spongiibacteraceae bacterium]